MRSAACGDPPALASERAGQRLSHAQEKGTEVQTELARLPEANEEDTDAPRHTERKSSRGVAAPSARASEI